MRQGPPRQLARRLARKFLGRADKDNPQLTVIEPPVEYMQEDLFPLDSSVPSEFLIMLKNLRFVKTYYYCYIMSYGTLLIPIWYDVASENSDF